MWDSSLLSILQVLVSIQGLITNSKPYFNEAGYDKLIGTTKGEKDSLSYKENTYLLNCKRMLHVMRRPLKGFEELLREHFVGRCYYILKANDAYLKGYYLVVLIKMLHRVRIPNQMQIQSVLSVHWAQISFRSSLLHPARLEPIVMILSTCYKHSTVLLRGHCIACKDLVSYQ